MINDDGDDDDDDDDEDDDDDDDDNVAMTVRMNILSEVLALKGGEGCTKTEP